MDVYVIVKDIPAVVMIGSIAALCHTKRPVHRIGNAAVVC